VSPDSDGHRGRPGVLLARVVGVESVSLSHSSSVPRLLPPVRRVPRQALRGTVGAMLLRASKWLLVGALVSRIASVAAIVVISRLLLPRELGRLTLALTAVTLLAGLSCSGLVLGVARQVAETRREDPMAAGRYLGVTILLTTLAGLAVTIGYLLAARTFCALILRDASLPRLGTGFLGCRRHDCAQCLASERLDRTGGVCRDRRLAGAAWIRDGRRVDLWGECRRCARGAAGDSHRSTGGGVADARTSAQGGLETGTSSLAPPRWDGTAESRASADHRSRRALQVAKRCVSPRPFSTKTTIEVPTRSTSGWVSKNAT
jgi:hypothetical protein